jgi:carbonic anhydrase
VFDELLAANRTYASHFELGGLPPRTARGFALVTCMDTRIDPLAILGLKPGDAKIIRNAGGRATPDAMRSLVLAVYFLGVTHIAVMHHTTCALAGTTDEQVLGSIPEEQRAPLQGTRFLSMPDPDSALREDVETVRSHPGLPPGIQVEGWRYDVDSGLVQRLIGVPFPS